MAGSVIRIEGLEKTLARFDVKRYEPEIQTCFNNFGLRVELAAKQAVPVDEGKLKEAGGKINEAASPKLTMIANIIVRSVFKKNSIPIVRLQLYQDLLKAGL